MLYLAQANTTFEQFGELVMFDSRDAINIDEIESPDQIVALTPKARGIAGRTFVNGVVGQLGNNYYMTNFMFNTRRTKFSDMITNPVIGSYNVGADTVMGVAHQNTNSLATVFPEVARDSTVAMSMPMFGCYGAYGGGYSYTFVARMNTITGPDIYTLGNTASYETYRYDNPKYSFGPVLPELLIMRGQASYGHERPGYGGRAALINSNCISWLTGNFVPEDEKPILDLGIMYSPALKVIVKLKDELVVSDQINLPVAPGTKPSLSIRSRATIQL
ncbi:hypothetical protein pEaSNUABM14_00195 [Erwinia phage pEa_SNUABM_14]|uniref:Uncharacterized protein n=1 Tax=Erwinia phage pEa_SNUABM_7 TaxID=2866695 RepID=A0AAE7WT06_9CAUD|nr:hypothetical protein MPK74_gp196 [Erwinia phage pEa_SNUABM_7]QYW04520.1 hypothetical protein pEaSNUABM14_00195 [Erwinia phage pEa_SNUABM_14]QYW04864.1 hypothetical protein pEaSNUABM7_00196 [Erwinia phage pEa_SNUABM_7]QYW05209.1 hypothetical protein pEaSNUABM21_00195 [Erwinia phage pEa_SNUABM_21]QYW05551.1 hypothetical protein pEaSNUABM25_00195 [Erwinia phage pEa_SNUABM_25]